MFIFEHLMSIIGQGSKGTEGDNDLYNFFCIGVHHEVASAENEELYNKVRNSKEKKIVIRRRK